MLGHGPPREHLIVKFSCSQGAAFPGLLATLLGRVDRGY